MRAAARSVGVDKTTVRRWVGTAPQEKRAGSETVQEGIQELRERHFRMLSARLEGMIETAPLKDLKDGYVAWGIADDKMVGRSPGGAHATANAQAVIMQRIAPDAG